jgi:hypothetical protein
VHGSHCEDATFGCTDHVEIGCKPAQLWRAFFPVALSSAVSFGTQRKGRRRSPRRCADLLVAEQHLPYADLFVAVQLGCADLLVVAQQLPRGLFLHAFSSGHIWSPAGRKMKDGPEQWSELE